MESIIAYVLKVNAALIIFYLLYILMLKKDTFLMLRRWFFLSAVVFSCIYPFFAVDALGDIFPIREKAVAEEIQTTVIVGEPTVMAVVTDDIAKPAFSIPWEQLFYLLFATITVVFVLRFLWQLISILRIRAISEKRTFSGINIYHLSKEITPFSFFKWIFINTERHSQTELNQILLHEQAHVSQWHSVDVIIMELLCVVFWWNPFVWLMKREMTINLEYLADNNVLRHGVNSREYQYHLLRLTYHETAVPIVNNFNVSQLKQRIMMMNKTKTPALKLLKYVFILPVLFLLITLNSAYAQDQKGDKIYTEVEKYPEFPGGNAALMKYLAETIKYPVIAQENNEQGRVLANFVVEKDGTVSNIKVIRGVTTGLDNEAIRILSSMPNWTPGEQKGEKVRVRFTLPVVFRLQGDNVPPSKTPTTPVSTDADEKGKMLEEVVVVGYMAPSSRGKIPTAQEYQSKSDELFVAVENQPQYPGGTDAMMKFLSDSLQYPKIARENGIQGRVITNFVVEPDGSLSEIQVVRGVDPSLDVEAVRLIGSMPKWTPGTQRGNKVRVRYTLPINFRLDGGVNTTDDMKPVTSQNQSESSKIEEIFVVVENQPEFPGGTEAMMKFLGENIRYPKEAHEKRIQGHVIANFVVMKDGSISDVNIVRGVDPGLDAEAIRLIGSMPKWKPGTQRGQPVNVRFTLPVVFQLSNNTENKTQTTGFQSENVQSPVFPGGESAYFKFLSDNIRYPVMALENGIQGLVSVVYNIDSKGKVSFVKFLKSVDPSLDKEVRRVIELMPDWTPGTYNEEPTSVTSGASFVFCLQGLSPVTNNLPKDALVVVGYRNKK